MNCIKKKTLFVTTAFLGIGGYILYQNLKTRIDDLEEEIWGMEDSELEVCPYCERVCILWKMRYVMTLVKLQKKLY